MKKFIIIAICAVCLSAAGALLYAGAYDSNLQLLSTSAPEGPVGKCNGDKDYDCYAECSFCHALYYADAKGQATAFSGTCTECGHSVNEPSINTGDVQP